MGAYVPLQGNRQWLYTTANTISQCPGVETDGGRIYLSDVGGKVHALPPGFSNPYWVSDSAWALC